VSPQTMDPKTLDQRGRVDPAGNDALPAKELTLIDAWWRAANYLSVGQWCTVARGPPRRWWTRR